MVRHWSISRKAERVRSERQLGLETRPISLSRKICGEVRISDDLSNDPAEDRREREDANKVVSERVKRIREEAEPLLDLQCGQGILVNQEHIKISEG
jgi:hypothetical protein